MKKCLETYKSKQPSKKTKVSILYFKILILLLKLTFCDFKMRYLINGISEINMVIKGNGTQSLLYSGFSIDPFEVIVDGKKEDSCKKTCVLNNDINNITIKFDKQIKSCSDMFKALNNIIEIDLSNFDTSKVTTMSWMFCDSYNIEKINLGSINTSLVENMDLLFKGTKITSIDLSNFDTSKVTTMSWMFCDCSKLETINLSNFDTSQVTDMSLMFSSCSSLKSLDLSNFDTLEVKTMKNMFSGCNSLIYLNLNSFQLNSEINKNDLFSGIYNKAKYCIRDIEMQKSLLGNDKVSNCSDDCFKENIKIDIKNNLCLDSCNTKYEYNNICKDECPKETYPLFCEEKECNNIIRKCYDKTPEGYYLDLSNKVYKKCFESCKSCKDEGNITNHNCLECNSNFMFLKDLPDGKNCYNSCEYYYYNEENNNYCTDNKTCPEKYNKLIIDKNKCIDECKNDSLFIYEYENICYINCPNDTIHKENDTICYENKIIDTKFIYAYETSIFENMSSSYVHNFNISEIEKKLLFMILMYL